MMMREFLRIIAKVRHPLLCWCKLIVAGGIGLFSNGAVAAELLMRGDTARSPLLAALYATPDGTQTQLRALQGFLQSRQFSDSDVVSLDLQSKQISVISGKTLYQHLISHPPYQAFDLTQIVVAQKVGESHFLTGQNRTSLNAFGSVVYVGQLIPEQYQFIGVLTRYDFDEDSLTDDLERRLGLNPELDDTDGNGIRDPAEDSDGDGFSNVAEVFAGSDPGDPLSVPGGGPVNECELQTDNCDINASCTDTVESFMCTCDAGYQGDGTSCAVDDGTDVTYRASFNIDGSQRTGSSEAPSLSVDGTFVAYESVADQHCFLHTADGRTVQLDVADPALSGAGGLCESTSVSRYGEYVAFASNASNLAAMSGFNNEGTNVYVRSTGSAPGVSPAISPATELVSLNSDLSTPSSAGSPAISHNGRFVTFSASSDNFAPGDTNGLPDIHLYDRMLGSTQLISVPSGHRLSAAQSSGVAKTSASGTRASDDGRYIAFVSSADGLDPQDGRTGSNDFDIFLRDTELDQTKRISVALDGGDPNGNSDAPAISSRARFIAFTSFASNLVTGDTNGTEDVFVRDTARDITTRVNTRDDGTVIDTTIGFIDINADGRFVSFEDASTGALYVKDRTTGNLHLINHVRDNFAEMATFDGQAAPAVQHSLSGNGNVVAFSSKADNLILQATDTNDEDDIYVHRSQNLHTYTLTPNVWYQLAFPSGFSNGTETLRTLLSDDGLGVLDDGSGVSEATWVVFEYDFTLESPRYQQLTLDDPVGSGKAYWITHFQPGNVTIDIGPAKVDLAAQTIASDSCQRSDTFPPTYQQRCITTAVDDYWEFPLSNGIATTFWSMVGGQGTHYITKQDLRVITNSNDFACGSGCTFSRAQNFGTLYDQMFGWEPELSSYIQFGDADYLSPWNGFWLSTNVQGGRDKGRMLAIPEAPNLR